MNAVAEALTGWTLAESDQRPLEDVFHIVSGTSRRPVENPALLALRQGMAVRLSNHTILISRDGTARPIDDSASPMRSETGAAIGAVLVFRDVTEHKRAEETRARLAAIVADVPTTRSSARLSTASFNRGMPRRSNSSAIPTRRRSANLFTLIIPSDRYDEERQILDRLCRGERVDHFETIRVAKDGRLRDISLTVSPIRDKDGRVIGASKIARDIGDRKRSGDCPQGK